MQNMPQLERLSEFYEELDLLCANKRKICEGLTIRQITDVLREAGYDEEIIKSFIARCAYFYGANL
jgi:hypothetical protein